MYFLVKFTGSKPSYWSAYGKGEVPMILAGVTCTGSEETILDCKKKPVPNTILLSK